MGSRAFAGRRSAVFACTAVALTGAATVVGAAPAAASEVVAPTEVRLLAPQANRPPVAVDDTATAQDGASATVDLFANDADPDGDALSLVGGTSAGHGAVSFGEALATYTPDADFAGVDSFTYLVGDGRGGTSSATVTITVVLTERPAPAEPVTHSDPMPPAATPWPGRGAPGVSVAPPAAPAAPAVAPEPPAAPAVVTGAGSVVTSAARPATARTRTPGAAVPVAAPVAAPKPVQAAPQAAAPRMGPSTVPYAAPDTRPATLPFTGPTDTLLPLGAGLLLVGGVLTLTGRRPTQTS